MNTPTPILALVFTVIGFSAGILIGIQEGKFIIKPQALKRGFATWEIVNPETGETEFKWKEAQP